MRYYSRRPSPPLAGFIESIWFCENEPRPRSLERILPTGAAQLIVNLVEDATRSYSTANGESCQVSPGTILGGVTTRFQAVAFALVAFRARPSMTRIAAVTDAISLSPKRFIERFKAEVGVTPKRYCRILRFQRVLARVHATMCVDWSQVALECRYFDQAHLIHDFQAFAGLTPTAYQASRTSSQNHVNFLQSGDD